MAWQAHAAYHAGLAEAAAHGMRGPDEASWAQAISRVLDDLRSAHQWAVIHEPRLALRLSAGLVLYGETGGPSEICTWAKRAAAVAGQDPAEPLLPIVLAAAAGVRFRGDLAGQPSFARRALEVVGDSGDPVRRYALYALADVALFEGRLEDATALYSETRGLAEKAADAYFAAYATAGAVLPWAYQVPLCQAALGSCPIFPL